MKPATTLLAVWIFAFGDCQAADAPAQPKEILEFEVTVDAGPHRRVDTPVSIELPKNNAFVSGQIKVWEIRGQQQTPVSSQEQDGPSRIWWRLSGVTQPGQKRRFKVKYILVGRKEAKDDSSKQLADDAKSMIVDKQKSSLIVRRGKNEILKYNAAPVEPPEGIGKGYTREAFIHPIRSPSGRILTDDYPPDHAHQNGLFFAYTKTEFEGRSPNFWETPAKKGAIRFKDLISKQQGDLFAQFQVGQQFIDLTAPDKRERPVLNEKWKVRVWNSPTPENKFWVIDFQSTFDCVTESPLNLPKYHYGGMAIRGARDWKLGHCEFITSEGLKRKAGNHTRPHWCDLFGPLNDQPAGIAIMTHPSNFRFPEPLRIHPSMPYMVYSPSHLGPWSIEPGKSHVSSYRFIAHDGELAAEIANRLWTDFAHPPTVAFSE